MFTTRKNPIIALYKGSGLPESQYCWFNSGILFSVIADSKNPHTKEAPAIFLYFEGTILDIHAKYVVKNHSVGWLLYLC